MKTIEELIAEIICDIGDEHFVSRYKTIELMKKLSKAIINEIEELAKEHATYVDIKGTPVPVISSEFLDDLNKMRVDDC